jgi:hypothetical protein
MKKINWQFALSFALIGLATLIYVIHYLVFRNLHDIFFYGVMDIAFTLVQVLFVTLVLNRLMNYREKQALMQKMNMVIGAFFNEVGSELLKKAAQFEKSREELSRKLMIDKEWTDRRFLDAKKELDEFKHEIDSRQGDLAGLKEFLNSKREFLLRLLENPLLLEHETFTDLLWAVFHLTDELVMRQDMSKLSEADYAHLSVDIGRAYGRLVSEWLLYMKHLKEAYPFLYSFAIRTNPFDPKASVSFM